MSITSENAVDRRVAVLDDHELLAESLEIALSVHGYDVRRIRVPDSGSAPAELVTVVRRIRPQVLLLDLDLGGFGDGTCLIGPLSRAGVRVVVLTGSTDHARWGAALAVGAWTVVPKSRGLNEVISVVRRINEGIATLDLAERDRLVATWQQRLAEHSGDEERLGRLTAREAEVLGDLMRGMQVREIAEDDVVSEATVRTQVKSILAKLDVSSQLAAVNVAHRALWQAPIRDPSTPSRSRHTA